MKYYNKTDLELIAHKYKSLSPYLDERARRLWCACEAKSYGYGGVHLISKATGVSRTTIQRGLKELSQESPINRERVRRPGGGRKKLVDTDPTLETDLKALVDPITRGDPESPLLWTCKSTHNLARSLQDKGHKVSAQSVRRLLSDWGYSLQGNKKTKEGSSHPDRNAQFEYINERVLGYQQRGQPTISVDTKKKENIGEFKNKGREYSKKGQPIKVKTHDFPDPKLGKAAPYGIYDIERNEGWVNVGISSDTSQFAVNSIRKWWKEMGKSSYPEAKELFITADCGGSNGYRTRLWKLELQKLSDETGLTISVSHFPPGTSKWNKIEHRLFCFISQNWRGKPLLTLQTVINLISNTKTKKGLTVKAVLDENEYKKGLKVTDEEMANINVVKNDFHGEWNYKIAPRNRMN